MGRNINLKHSLIFLIGSFLYMNLSIFLLSTTIGRLFIEDFKGLNISTVSIIVLIISFILTIIYTFRQYEFNQLIYKIKAILIAVIIIIIMLSIGLTIFHNINIKNYNNKITQNFKSLDAYINLSKYYENLEFRIDSKTNELVKIKYGKEKIELKKYKPTKLDNMNFITTSKYYVYELNDAYLFSIVDNEKKNFIIKKLNNKYYFYQVNIDTEKLKDNFKYFELKLLNNKKGYDQMDIDKKEYLSIQDTQQYLIYRQYYANFYVLYKAIAIKPEIRKAYKNISSISYAKNYTNITINNEQYKIYTKMDENFKLIFYEK